MITHPSTHKVQAGFTLVEILIVIAIIGILYAVAMPSYSSYIQQSRRADIQQVILQQAAVLERQYTRVGGYPHSYTFPDSEFYQLSYQSDATSGESNGSEFYIQAKPIASQTADSCGKLGLDHTGTKHSEDVGCW
ncbi:type IV pilin protein [Pseudoalteromonas shioyasakiensis]|uniref:type IV pilin protein n=1 Tax=Pseudoalteromonas shioyasakiensis TaxID=1190813 RepID=UPI002741FF7B|nr:type IV pilin protein [Pseudoalteromonas shioyasakiensis]